MFDLPPHQPHPPFSSGRPVRSAAAFLRPRPVQGESVEGWVIAEITPYPRPLRRVSQFNAGNGAEGFTEGFTAEEIQSLERFWEAQYAPPTAQFVLAVVEYPSGPVSQWRPLRWPEVEIVLRSPQEWPAQGDSPHESPELGRLVDDLARQALAAGWEPLGRGRLWCSLRFRQRYARLAGMLRWK